MPETLDHIAYLSHEIGPRPAGTEEEQQAALYITEKLQKEAGLSATIEDFNSESNGDLPGALCCIVSLVFAIAGMFLPIMAIPSFILLLLAGGFFALEAFGKPFLSKFFARGVSQNVVAKYEPGISSSTGGARRRKIILVTNYDSGKVRAELNAPLLGVLNYIQKGTLIAMVFLPILFLIRALFFLHASGIVAIILNIITVIALIFVLVTLVVAFVHKLASYNEAANNNASGTAVLLEVAKKIGNGQSFSERHFSQNDTSQAFIHGEEAARESGLVPEGADLIYEAARIVPSQPSQRTEGDRLASAKSAIAAMTGQPVAHTTPAPSIADNLVQMRNGYSPSLNEGEGSELHAKTREAFSNIPHETLEKALQSSKRNEDGLSSIPDQDASEIYSIQDTDEQPGNEASFTPQQPSSAVPDWFKKAQENARKPEGDKPTVAQRSRFADALDKAVSESSSHFSQANKAVDDEMEERLAQMRSSIMEGGASISARADTHNEETLRSSAFSEDFQKHSPLQESNQELEREANRDDGALGNKASFADSQKRIHPVSIQADEKETTDGEESTAFAGGGTIAMQPIDVNTIDYEQNLVSRTPSADISSADWPKEGSPTQGYPQDLAYAEKEQEALDEERFVVGEAKQPVSLPEITSAIGDVSLVEGAKQRAPLAMSEDDSSKSTAKSLLSMLPSIESDDFSESQEQRKDDSIQEATFSDLRTDLPSLSGALDSNNSSVSSGQGNISSAGSFAPAGATGAFAPVGQELLENVDPADIYVEDADDSVYEDNFTNSGAFAGPDYVDMPKSRTRRFFKRFGSKKKDQEAAESTQQWLDIDEEFEARSVGEARGGWESFQEPQNSYYDQDEYYEDETLRDIDPNDNNYSKEGGRPWQGGAFSKIRARGLRQKISYDDLDESDQNELNLESEDAIFSGEIPSRSRRERVSLERPSVDFDEDIDRIAEFRASGFDADIWFVALGSELAHNGGMRAFMAEHSQDMRGAIIINIEACGAGEMSFVEKEGVYRPSSVSSRMKRYVKKTSQEVGMEVPSTNIYWKESAASVATSRGYQAMSLVGMEGMKPAKYAQADDTLEGIEEETLSRNTEFIFRLLKNI